MRASELIERKRDGAEIGEDELHAFLDAYADGQIADYQMSSFLMAVFFRGLTNAELDTVTRTIIASGRALDFRDGGPPAVDKHSTGGVGDKVSLILAPLLAEAGLRVPMMSGRGLGHSGGTLDKLESIPGFRTQLAPDEVRRALDEIGVAMLGQSAEIAPLDGRLYALRDVSGTVPSIPLIASSIISKKVAEGIEALVLDVKCGSGAFMRDRESARSLAIALVALSERMGLRSMALITDMEAPLGHAVGNALETTEAIDCLRGGGPADLRELTLDLCVELVLAVDAGADGATARSRLAALLDDGRAAERFARLVERQGGDARVVEDPTRLPSAPVRLPFSVEDRGAVTRVDAREIGLAAVELGAGRRLIEDEIDPAVGFRILVAPGQEVESGAPLAEIHASDEDSASLAMERLRSAITVDPDADRAPEASVSRVLDRVDVEGVSPVRARPG